MTEGTIQRDIDNLGRRLINNYRSQFRRILGRSSFEELLQKVRDKV